MKKNLLKCLCLPLGMLCVVLSACSDDNTEPTKKTEYTVTEFASTTIPETIPAEGGAYTMTFTTRTETRLPAGRSRIRTVAVPCDAR